MGEQVTRVVHYGLSVTGHLYIYGGTGNQGGTLWLVCDRAPVYIWGNSKSHPKGYKKKMYPLYIIGSIFFMVKIFYGILTHYVVHTKMNVNNVCPFFHL